MRIRYIRYGLLVVVLSLVTYLALGFGARSFEAYCPFGGMESLWGLFTSGEFSCALAPLNLSMLLAVLVLTLITKKSFCGWTCPIGFLGELCGRLSRLVTGRRTVPAARLDRWLRMIRYLVLIVSLYFTYRMGELILRGYDPFYLIFSGIGHGAVGVVSWTVLIVILAGALVVPMFFCRYLCPLGAVFDPFGWLGVIKVVRNEGACTACGSCQTACPHDIPVHTSSRVRHRDCTNCLECIDACPERDVLSLRATL